MTLKTKRVDQLKYSQNSCDINCVDKMEWHFWVTYMYAWNAPIFVPANMLTGLTNCGHTRTHTRIQQRDSNLQRNTNDVNFYFVALVLFLHFVCQHCFGMQCWTPGTARKCVLSRPECAREPTKSKSMEILFGICDEFGKIWAKRSASMA